jgi:hypothetical protein
MQQARPWTSARLHDATSQKTVIFLPFIVAAVRTWNLSYILSSLVQRSTPFLIVFHLPFASPVFVNSFRPFTHVFYFLRLSDPPSTSVAILHQWFSFLSQPQILSFRAHIAGVTLCTLLPIQHLNVISSSAYLFSFLSSFLSPVTSLPFHLFALCAVSSRSQTLFRNFIF